jgi:hypothetical protein
LHITCSEKISKTPKITLFQDSVTDGVAVASRVSRAHYHLAIFVETDHLYASERELPRTADFNFEAILGQETAYIGKNTAMPNPDLVMILRRRSVVAVTYYATPEAIPTFTATSANGRRTAATKNVKPASRAVRDR